MLKKIKISDTILRNACLLIIATFVINANNSFAMSVKSLSSSPSKECIKAINEPKMHQWVSLHSRFTGNYAQSNREKPTGELSSTGWDNFLKQTIFQNITAKCKASIEMRQDKINKSVERKISTHITNEESTHAVNGNSPDAEKNGTGDFLQVNKVCTWVGGASGNPTDWFNDSNWIPQTPTAQDTARIMPVGPINGQYYYPIITTNQQPQCARLIIYGQARVIIDAPNEVVVGNPNTLVTKRES